MITLHWDEIASPTWKSNPPASSLLCQEGAEQSGQLLLICIGLLLSYKNVFQHLSQIQIGCLFISIAIPKDRLDKINGICL